MTGTGFALWMISSAHLPFGWSATGLHSLQELSPDFLVRWGQKTLFHIKWRYVLATLNSSRTLYGWERLGYTHNLGYELILSLLSIEHSMPSTAFALGMISSATLPFGLRASVLHCFQELSPDQMEPETCTIVNGTVI